MLDIDVIKRWFDYLYSIGADETGGVTRLGYTKNEDVMHGAIRNFAREMGLKYSSDEVGNTYVYDEDYSEYYLIGSHLDSVISGGRYDGVLGVLAGLLILKWIKDNNLNIPLKVVAFRCEESSSFGIATVGSGLITKKLQIEKMKKVKNTEGVSLYEALRFRGYNPECKKIEGVLNYFELHIEQGRILEDEGLKIGIINSIAAATRYWLTIDGRQDHSGATPMGMRQDALCAAGEIIIELENIAKRESIHSSVGTVGYLGNYPNAFNVVPGRVKMGLDIRGVEKDSIDRIDDEIVKFVDEVCKKRNLNYELDNISKAIPVKLDENLKNELSEIATKLGVEHKIMNSGAGHDAMKFWDIAPTGMVFIPCKDGVSHNKAEEIEYEDIILGSKIIFEELKQLNSRR
ncbi:MAG: M20 family metallo-hydrolase [Fusobacterium sp.]|uniref:M20 family metallo-hydrolase n=1 Tax=Fusobacterium sp. TaxID=68766 RepID=UPI002941D96F|nr:M20 family metallo-hydrolase [Fusobacterium sp.]MDY3059394.1 M20 family metallo-hydrolase [Fusobacterium sp.]MEE1477250.1 M20 family metallo-hydrolase [Fusobacterium sp.]